MLRNEAGETLEVEFLNAGPLFDRIINPYVENLRAIGIDARMNRVDGAQMSQRQRDADFDIITDHFPMGYEPGPSLRQYFGTIGADESLFNAAGLADPVIDELLEVVIRAETRDEMEVATRALDRVLRSYRIRVPQWFNDSAWVAYYNHYRYPGGASALWHRVSRFLVGRSGGRAGACATRACSDPRWAPISSDGCCS
jgi:microcin C transport system substrate-binding protein